MDNPLTDFVCWVASGLNLPQFGDGTTCNNDRPPHQLQPLPLTGDSLVDLFNQYPIDEPFRPYSSPPVYQPPVQAPVEIPERKLPQEADGQSNFDTPDGRSISLQESLKNRKLGRLLWNPLSDSIIEVTAPKLDYLPNKLTELRTASANRFAQFITDSLEKDEEGNVKNPLNLWEKTAFAFTDTPSGLGGELNLMFGLRWFRELINANKKSSQIALMKVHDFIPKQVKINSQNVNFEQSFSNEIVDTSGNFPNQNNVNLENIEKILGIELNNGELQPLGKLPKNLLNINGQDALININNYPDLILWIIKQMDSLIGQFPIEIEIEDSDATEEGNQTQKIKLANIAEALREIYGLNVIESQFGDINFNVLMKLIPELYRIRQEVLVTGDMIQACREFLGFRHKEIEKEIDNQFTMTTKLEDIKDIPAFLQGNTSKYKTIIFEGEESVQDYLQRIMYVSSIMKSSILKKVQTVDDFLQTIYEREGDEENKDWESFKDLINDPESFFNLDEKRSKLRDMGDLGGE